MEGCNMSSQIMLPPEQAASTTDDCGMVLLPLKFSMTVSVHRKPLSGCCFWFGNLLCIAS